MLARALLILLAFAFAGGALVVAAEGINATAIGLAVISGLCFLVASAVSFSSTKPPREGS